MSEIQIDVTRDDIDAGVQSHCYACPIALAFKRATGADLVEVDELGAGWYDIEAMTDRAVAIPDVAARFIHAFDAGRDVQPFSFTVTL